MNSNLHWNTVSAITLISISTMGVGARADAVITPTAMFLDCSDAIEYRDGPLVIQLDQQFTRYQSDVQTRVNAVIQEFQAQAAVAKQAYENAQDDQKKQIAMQVGRFFALKLISKLSVKGLPKEVQDQMSKAEKEIWETVVERSGNLAIETSNMAFKKEVDSVDFIKGNAELVMKVLSHFYGPAGVVTEVGGFSIDMVLLWLNTDLPIKEHQGEYDELARSIQKLMSDSPKNRLNWINKTKEAIDKACG
jgi:hypothetical protein